MFGHLPRRFSGRVGVSLLPLVVVSAAVGWWLSLQGNPYYQGVVCLFALCALCTGMGSRGSFLLAMGAAASAGLLLYGFWPTPWPVVIQWGRDIGLATGSLGLPIRNPNLAPAMEAAGAIAVGCLGTIGLSRLCEREPRMKRLLLEVFAVALGLFMVAALFKIVAGEPYSGDNCVLSVRSKNEAATLCALALVLYLGLAFITARLEQWIRLILAGLGFGLSFFLLLNLRSWTGIVGASAGVLALVFFMPHASRSIRRRSAMAACLITAGLVVLFAFSPALAERSHEFLRDYRMGVWSDSMNLVRGRVLGGAGLGAFEREYPLVGSLQLPIGVRLAHPDSSWVLFAVEWGFLGTLVLVLCFGALIYSWPSSAEDHDAPGARAGHSSAVARSAVVAWLSCGVTDIALHRSATVFIGLSLVAIILSERRLPSWGAWVGRAGALSLSALAAVGVYLSSSWGATQVGPGALGGLTWDPLNPAVHFSEAQGALSGGGESAVALAHFRAVVTLEHSVPAVAEQVAKSVRTFDFQAAAFFWREAFRQAKGDSSGYGLGVLNEAIASSGNQEGCAYWIDVVRNSDPALLVGLAAYPGFDRDALLSEWLQSDRRDLLRLPAYQDRLFKSLAGKRLGGVLRDKIRDACPDAGCKIRYARYLHSQNDDAAAWAIVSSMPMYTLSSEDTRLGRVSAVIALARSIKSTRERVDFLQMATKSGGNSRLTRLELARALAETGRYAEACDAALLNIDPASAPQR